MFWGVTLETGKRYSQVVDSSYHLSMAALEPLPSSVESPAGKFVSVMIEHNKSEFLLCTLEHNKILQVTLDHCFVEGEEVTYFLTGEGTVHLTGYIMTDGVEGAEDSDESEENEGISMASLKKRVKLTNKQKDDSEDDDDDEEDEDWKPDLKKTKTWPALVNNVPGKFKGTLDNKNATPKVKMEKSKPDLEKPPEKESKKPQKVPVESPVPTKQSSDDDDEDDEDFLMADFDEDEDDDDDEEEGETGEDSDGDEENSEWESAEDEEESPGRPVKKAKLEGDLSKGKHPTGTPNVGKEKSPHVATPTVIAVNTPNQQKASSKKKKNKKHSEDTPQVKTPSQKNSIDVSRSSSDSTPQSGSKARKTIGGVEVQDLVQGNGPTAKVGKMVHVYYRGTFPDKREFDSCTRGKAFNFRLGRAEVIKGWDVGIQGMKVGGKRKLIVPPSMGYGSKASGPIPPNSTLHFEVELKAVS